ncbi:NADH-quinone oxidoreductase subunit M [Propionibacterium freudenreichii]|uniref:NADH-quinone oxidoreductase subunit M n=1 Tax=Propionibacterium freudenreichii TaxID=1744 RepID=UPI000BC2F0BE|nr:NADH-quinone oxidoreductase subunit M [Propionibacterium freudenreichii]MDK9294736.1 NADH-quinone oxidoreductase subunit M [Propionibacterium freudenreichii]MDK9360108.1 NADH-quinone oxidoreductase subunit M [Propionibacterium freudenreichii]MDK9638728.1 NADH-quinone oxidoreductase subunit M [Propionibacterium freudenreichii]MDK9659661.1 NADH-quinone oxidoreductase subunit M [Propionibacterium freudenreichii]WGU89775.1 NADH-quinone oxidoreductase subunit M [Propionibacterium freudenreichii]
MTFPWLTVLGLLPLLGSVIVFALRGRGGKVAAMVFSLVTLVVGVATFFMTGLTEKVSWISPIGAWYALDLDGMSKVLVLLTVILVPIVLIAEWHVGDSSTQNQNAADTTSQVAPARWSSETFMALALMLEGFTLYVFMASDLLLFYIFFEATLIPMYFLIAGWGGARRAAAAMKFLLFSLFGGFVLLLGVIGMYAVSAGAGKPSLLTADLAGLSMGQGMERWLFVAFFIAFAIKAPMVPVHTWLPDAAEQARPGASTLLVATLDKIGTFGMIRFCLAFFPEATKWASPFVLVLAVISIFYGAFMAIGSKNLLRLVAYTSVSHFGFMVLGIFSFTTESITGSIFYMLAHGFSAAAMFLVVGFLIDRRGSALIADFGGAQKLVPLIAGVYLTAGLATLGLPGLANFAGEYMIMAGVWQRHLVFVAVAVVATVLAAVYIMLSYQRVFTGPATEQSEKHMTHDLTGRERLVIAPLIALLLFFGCVPKPTFDVVNPTAKEAMVQVSMVDPQPTVKRGK